MEDLYKEGQLPESCPPASAIQREIILYRLCEFSVPHENDYIPYVRAYREERFINDCKAYGLSFFDNFDVAVQKLSKGRSKNIPFAAKTRYIVKVKIKETDGVIENATGSPHYSLWVYRDAKILELEYIEVVEV